MSVAPVGNYMTQLPGNSILLVVARQKRAEPKNRFRPFYVLIPKIKQCLNWDFKNIGYAK